MVSSHWYCCFWHLRAAVQTAWISWDWLGKLWLSNCSTKQHTAHNNKALHGNAICSFAPFLMDIPRHCHLLCETESTTFPRHIENKSRCWYSKYYRKYYVEMQKNGKGEISVSRWDSAASSGREMGSQNNIRCVNSLNISKLFVFSQLCVFHHLSHDVLFRPRPSLSHTAYLWS